MASLNHSEIHRACTELAWLVPQYTWDNVDPEHDKGPFPDYFWEIDVDGSYKPFIYKMPRNITDEEKKQHGVFSKEDFGRVFKQPLVPIIGYEVNRSFLFCVVGQGSIRDYLDQVNQAQVSFLWAMLLFVPRIRINLTGKVVTVFDHIASRTRKHLLRSSDSNIFVNINGVVAYYCPKDDPDNVIGSWGNSMDMNPVEDTAEPDTDPVPIVILRPEFVLPERNDIGSLLAAWLPINGYAADLTPDSAQAILSKRKEAERLDDIVKREAIDDLPLLETAQKRKNVQEDPEQTITKVKLEDPSPVPINQVPPPVPIAQAFPVVPVAQTSKSPVRVSPAVPPVRQPTSLVAQESKSPVQVSPVVPPVRQPTSPVAQKSKSPALINQVPTLVPPVRQPERPVAQESKEPKVDSVPVVQESKSTVQISPPISAVQDPKVVSAAVQAPSSRPVVPSEEIKQPTNNAQVPRSAAKASPAEQKNLAVRPPGQEKKPIAQQRRSTAKSEELKPELNVVISPGRVYTVTTDDEKVAMASPVELTLNGQEFKKIVKSNDNVEIVSVIGLKKPSNFRSYSNYCRHLSLIGLCEKTYGAGYLTGPVIVRGFAMQRSAPLNDPDKFEELVTRFSAAGYLGIDAHVIVNGTRYLMPSFAIVFMGRPIPLSSDLHKINRVVYRDDVLREVKAFTRDKVRRDVSSVMTGTSAAVVDNLTDKIMSLIKYV